MSRVWHLVFNVWHNFPRRPEAGVAFSPLLPLLAAGRHFPSVDFSFLGGGEGWGFEWF